MTRRSFYLIATAFLAAGLLAIYLAGNGRVPLFDRDEPRYAVTSRAMLAAGDWVVPRFLGEVRTAKPPAIYWLQAGAMKLLGTGEFAVRLPGALACAATVLLIAWGLAPLAGRRRAGWAAFSLGTSVLVLGVAKVGVIDGVLLLCVAIVQLCLLRLVLRRGRDLTNAAVLWTAIGLGGLLKGPVILGVLLMTLLAWWALPRLPAWGRRAKSLVIRTDAPSAPLRDEPRRSGESGQASVRRLHVGLGVAILLLVCGPWLLMISLREPTFLATALGHDVAGRSVRGLEGHGQPPGFHLLVIFGTWFPWSVLLPATLIGTWRRRDDPLIRFALAACIGPWIMFELVATKLPHYLLVVFPMLALLTADWIVRSLRQIRRGEPPPGLRAAAVIYGAVALGFAVAPALLGVTSIAAMVAGVAWGAVLLVTWWRRRLRAGLVAAGIGMPLVVAIAYLDWLGRVPMLTVSERVAIALDDAGAPEALMVHYKEPSLGWYAIERGVSVREADEHVLATADGFATSTARRLERLAPEVRARWEVVTRIPTRLYNDSLQSTDVLVLRAVEPPLPASRTTSH